MPLDQVHDESLKKAEMGFFDHVEELRKHILRSLAAITVVGVVAFWNKDFLFDQLLFGPRNPDFLTYRFMCGLSHLVGAGDSLCVQPTKFSIMTRELGEVLMQHLTIAFWLGVIGAFPYILWEFWKFIRPGLHENEQTAIRSVVLVCSALFVTGVFFGYFVIAPFSINFLAGYTAQGLDVAPTLDSYVGYMTMFTIPTGLIFEMPVVAYFLAKIGLIGKQSLKAYRRHAFVAILIVAALITPPDVASQLIVTAPLTILYEVSIFVVGRVQKKRELAMSGSKAVVPRD